MTAPRNGLGALSPEARRILWDRLWRVLLAEPRADVADHPKNEEVPKNEVAADGVQPSAAVEAR